MVVEHAGQVSSLRPGAAADVVGRLEHLTSTPCWASRTAAASPLGPLPTTTAVVITPPDRRRLLDGGRTVDGRRADGTSRARTSGGST